MGKTKNANMGISLEELEQQEMLSASRSKKAAKKADKSAESAKVTEEPVSANTEDTKEDAKRVKASDNIQEKIEAKIEENKESTPVRAAKTRSKAYVAARRHIDRTKSFTVKKAVEMILKTSYSSFPGTVVVDVVSRDEKVSKSITFPHSTGKSVRVAIATDQLLEDISQGEINFDILLATPDMMPKLAKHARTLGPKGLMPNPKNQTVTTEPDKRKAELEGGKITIKTEKKAPLMHVVVGKTHMPAKELVDNIEQLIKVLDPRRILKAHVSATMSPAVSLDLSVYASA